MRSSQVYSSYVNWQSLARESGYQNRWGVRAVMMMSAPTSSSGLPYNTWCCTFSDIADGSELAIRTLSERKTRVPLFVQFTDFS